MLSGMIYIYIECVGSYNTYGHYPVWSVQWTVRGDMIDFVVSAETTGWVGIGFSGDRQMVVTLYIYSVYTYPHTYTHKHAHSHI